MSKCIDCVNFIGSNDIYKVLCKKGRQLKHIDAHDNNPCLDFQILAREVQSVPEIRTFTSGATRDTDADKPDYEGFLSSIVLQRFGEYMNKHREQSDGQLRDSDNWQKGLPLDTYIKSGWRHFMDWWLEHRGNKSREGLEDALCALLFNVSGYLHETLKAKGKE